MVTARRPCRSTADLTSSAWWSGAGTDVVPSEDSVNAIVSPLRPSTRGDRPSPLAISMVATAPPSTARDLGTGASRGTPGRGAGSGGGN